MRDIQTILTEMAQNIKFDMTGPSGLELLDADIAYSNAVTEVYTSGGFHTDQRPSPTAKMRTGCMECGKPIEQVQGKGRPKKFCHVNCNRRWLRAGKPRDKYRYVTV